MSANPPPSAGDAACRDTLPERRSLHIVHYLSDVRLDHGGVTRAVLDWCGVLAARGHRVTLITWDDRDAPAEWPRDIAALGVPRVQVVSPPGRLPLRLPGSALRVAAPLIASADVLHLHAPWLPGNAQFAALARRAGVPYVLSTHGMLDDWCMGQHALKKRLFLGLVGTRVLDGAAAIHFTADAERAQARRWFANPRIVVLPYLFDTAPFEHLPGPELARAAFPAAARPGRKVLFLSRVDRKKDVGLLIAAVDLLRQRDASEACTLLIAGPELDAGYSAELRRDISGRGMDEQVHFLGTVHGPQKLSLFQAADAMVLPTRQENFGLALFESMACGTPVLTTRGADTWREIESAGGIIVHPSTAEAFADAIARLLDEPSAQRALRAHGLRRWVMERLDAGRLATEYEALYGSLQARA